MIAVTVTYRVKPEFVEANKKNIQGFLDDFKRLDSSNFQYNVFTKSDGTTFVHSSIYRNEKAQAQLLGEPSFKKFQQLRDESGLKSAPTIEILNPIGFANTHLDKMA